VYRAALEGALEDRDVSERERSILSSLATQLEFSPEVATRLEAEMAG